jgi:hypothetical protein
VSDAVEWNRQLCCRRRRREEKGEVLVKKLAMTIAVCA